MNIEDFISILTSLNNGVIMSNIDNSGSEILIGTQDIRLFTVNAKYYFLSVYNDDYNIIEHKIRSNQYVNNITDIRPNNSYLILFYKIENFDEDTSKKIITLEENEFLFKRYVFYYTKKEWQSFIDWYSQQQQKELQSILLLEECSPESNELYMQFLLRLIIKMPFINLVFKKMELDNFEDLLNAQLNGSRNNKEAVLQMYEDISSKIETVPTEEIAGQLFSKIVGGIENEDSIN